MKVNIRTNGIRPDNTVAEFFVPYRESGNGGREASLYGCGESEIKARQQLIEQAKAMRDELNLAIEEMIEQLCKQLRDLPLADRIELTPWPPAQ